MCSTALRSPPRARVTSASVESSATGVMTAAIRGTPGRAARKFSRPVPARQTFSLIEGWFPTCSGRIPPLASRVWVARSDRDRLLGDPRFDPGGPRDFLWVVQRLLLKRVAAVSRCRRDADAAPRPPRDNSMTGFRRPWAYLAHVQHRGR